MVFKLRHLRSEEGSELRTGPWAVPTAGEKEEELASETKKDQVVAEGDHQEN